MRKHQYDVLRLESRQDAGWLLSGEVPTTYIIPYICYVYQQLNKHDIQQLVPNLKLSRFVSGFISLSGEKRGTKEQVD